MSPASYLTAPPRVALPSIAATGGPGSSIRGVTTAIWAAFGFLCVAFAAGTAWVGYQLVQAWRAVRALPGGLLGAVGELTERLAEVERRVGNVERQVGALQRQVDS